MHAANIRHIKVLESLVTRAHDLAYLQHSAIERLSAERCRRSVRAIYRLRTWRNLELASAALLLDGAPNLPARPTVRVWFQARMLSTHDHRIMQTLARRLAELIRAFDTALQESLPSRVRALLERQRSELVRHRAWLCYGAGELMGRSARAGRRHRPAKAGYSQPRVDEFAL